MTHVAPTFSDGNNAAEKTFLLRSNKSITRLMDKRLAYQNQLLPYILAIIHYKMELKKNSIKNGNKTYIVSGSKHNKECKCFKESHSMKKQTVH